MKTLRSMPYLPFYIAAARSVGLTAPQLNALEALAWSPDGEVWCRDLGIPQASVRKLAALGLVTVRVNFSGDGIGYVSLTPKGLETKRMAIGFRPLTARNRRVTKRRVSSSPSVARRFRKVKKEKRK